MDVWGVDMSEHSITKKALGSAMKDLMSAQSFADITVGDICQKCGLNRKSLYYHFEDKYDLVNWVFYSELIEPLEKKGIGDFWVLLEEITRYLYQNRMFYYHAFQVRGANRFWEYFSKSLQPYLFKAVHNQLAGGEIFTKTEKENAYAEFLADAFVYSIEKWIIQRPQLTPERYVDLFKINFPKTE